MFSFSKRSNASLVGVHPDLDAVTRRALQLTTIDFVVTEGLRSLDRQKELLAAGKSKTLKSRHLTGHAVDLCPLPMGKVSWDLQHFQPLAVAMKQAAKELNVPIVWGGDWTSFVDAPHFELLRSAYPA